MRICVVLSMNYKIIHKTAYHYSDLVNLCYNEARMTPRNFGHQRCHETEFVVTPEPGSCREREDFFGNTVHAFTLQRPHRGLTVTVTSRVTVTPRPLPRMSDTEHAWEAVSAHLHADTDPTVRELREDTLESPMVPMLPELRSYAAQSFTEGRTLFAAVTDLTARLFADFTYQPGVTTVATPVAEVMQHRRGVCQDFAHLGIGCLRAMRLAARYVSGYVETDPPPGQERLAGADASHAWFSVYFPQLGWIDFDPTNNQIPTDRHITVACGRDYADVAPLKGVVFGSGTHRLHVSVECQRHPVS